MPAFSSAALTAMPPRSTAEKPFSEPDSLPISVRAPLTMTEPAMVSLLRKVAGEGLPRYRRGPLSRTPPRTRGFPDRSACMFTRIDHVGIAVHDLDAAIEMYETAFGMRCVHTEVNEEQGVREAMMAVGDSGSYIQLLAPLSEDSTIGKYLAKNGEGIQQ